MESIWFDIGVSVLLSTLKSLKGEKKKAQLKKVFLKVYTAIKMAYADDPDFA
jgi:hypothetical protein